MGSEKRAHCCMLPSKNEEATNGLTNANVSQLQTFDNRWRDVVALSMRAGTPHPEALVSAHSAVCRFIVA